MNENSLFDKKSLKSLTINNPNWDEIAKEDSIIWLGRLLDYRTIIRL